MCTKNKIFEIKNKATGEILRTLVGEYESIVLNQAITLTGLRPLELDIVDTGLTKDCCKDCGKQK